MGSLLRAAFISAIATSALALALRKTSRPTFPPPLRDVPVPPRPAAPTIVETDALTAGQRSALLQEMEQQF